MGGDVEALAVARVGWERRRWGRGGVEVGEEVVRGGN